MKNKGVRYSSVSSSTSFSIKLFFFISVRINLTIFLVSSKRIDIEIFSPSIFLKCSERISRVNCTSSGEDHFFSSSSEKSTKKSTGSDNLSSSSSLSISLAELRAE
ncbi:hypothetical protein [Melioribacter sp. OK-6-Me]|uniref:hypothetical protein n=1 Tax=unclassified Melioribacter TaxID=2627329 RepID=UPI003ED976EE